MYLFRQFIDRSVVSVVSVVLAVIDEASNIDAVTSLFVDYFKFNCLV